MTLPDFASAERAAEAYITSAVARRQRMADLLAASTSSPLISVVLPSYQGAALLPTCLASLAAQSLDHADFEVIVVLNGTDDGSRSVVEEFATRHPRLDMRVLHSPTAGAGAARNLGLAAARGQYVTFVDDDDTVGREYLQSMASAARPDVIVVAPIADVLPDGRVDEESSLSLRLRSLQEKPRWSLAAAPWILGFSACKLIPSRFATAIRFATHLRSGEDVAYMSMLLGTPLDVVPAQPSADATYNRSLRDGSVSRGRRGFEFYVTERIQVIEELESVVPTARNRAALESIRRAQAGFIARFVEEHPDERHSVEAALELSAVVKFPWRTVFPETARDLAILYCFPPYLDPSGVVAAKALAARGRTVDVISANMSDTRARDDSVFTLMYRWMGLHAIVPARSRFGDWTAISEYATRAVRRADEWVARRGEYERLYTRALWAGSHIAGALFKLDHPSTHWAAEFSDPLSRGVDGSLRPGTLGHDATQRRLAGVLAEHGIDPDVDLTLFEFTELITFLLADELIFTNDAQREVMLSFVPPSVARIAQPKSVVRAHPQPVESAYHRVPSTVSLDPQVKNIGYFGSFYGNRTIREVTEALAVVEQSVRENIAFHVFCDRPDEFRDLVATAGLEQSVFVHGYLGYLEFLNAATKFDLLIVRDADTVGAFARNPFLPSKYSDYRGSGTPVWGIVEPGSPLSARSLDFRSELGDVSGAVDVLRAVVNSDLPTYRVADVVIDSIDDQVAMKVKHRTGELMATLTDAASVAEAVQRLLAVCRPEKVHDRATAAASEVRERLVQHLLPTLAPDGEYTFAVTGHGGDIPRILRVLNHDEDPQPADTPLLEALRSRHATCELTEDRVRVRVDGTRTHLLEAKPLADLTATVVTEEPAASYQRIEPHVLTPAMHTRMSRATHDWARVPVSEVQSAVLDDAVVFGQGNVMVNERYLVEESMINQRHSPKRGFLYRIGETNHFVTALDLAAARPVEDFTVIVKQTWDTNYGHWLVDTLPRMKYAAATATAGTDVKYLLNDPGASPMRAVFIESMAAFGIPESAVEFAGSPPLRLGKALYITPMTVPPLIKHPAAIRSLRDAFDVDGKQAPVLKLYVSRNKYSRRRLLNEDGVLALLAARGYHVVFPEDMTVSEQASMFSRATHVVANMGAALTNLVFAPEGVRVFALATQTMMHDYFYDIVCHLEGQYWALQGEATDATHGNASDFTIDLERFAAAMADFDAD